VALRAVPVELNSYSCRYFAFILQKKESCKRFRIRKMKKAYLNFISNDHINSCRKVSDFNEMTMHFLHVIKTHVDLTRGPQVRIFC
jgi:hypothetical protein